MLCSLTRLFLGPVLKLMRQHFDALPVLLQLVHLVVNALLPPCLQCSGDCVLELLQGCPVQLLQIDAFNARISGEHRIFAEYGLKRDLHCRMIMVGRRQCHICPCDTPVLTDR
jgi:hypothetical protein